jgi:hypothetical protein
MLAACIREFESARRRIVVALGDVFGLNRFANPLSYVVRPVEESFKVCLIDNSVVVVVVYGMSKQGKTSLLRHALPDDRRIFAHCNRNDTLQSIFKNLLNKCGIQQDASQTSGVNGEASVGVGWFKARVGAKNEVVREYFGIDVSNADSVANIIARNDGRRIIVLDNFHYLQERTQKELATAVRSFETCGFKFVIIGTWNEDGYLQSYNNDLAGTVKEFSFEEWNFGDLKSVLDRGFPLLNVALSGPVQQSLIHRSLNNVALLQELTKDYLALQGVGETCATKRVIGDVDGVTTVASQFEERLFKDIVKLLLPITRIGSPWVDGKSRSWWMLYAFLHGKHEDVVRGMPQDALYKMVCDLAAKKGGNGRGNGEPFTVQQFTGLLQHHWHEEQTKDQATPVLAYHDINRSLVVVDAYTKFVLRTQELRQRMRASI